MLKYFKKSLKSVSSNLTLAVSTPNFNRPRLTFCLIFGGEKRKNIARPGFEPMIIRSKVSCANHHSLLEDNANF